MDGKKPPQRHYEPSGNDVRWAQQLVNVISEGGVWGAPATGLVYQFHHASKTVTLQNPQQLASDEAAYMHHQTKMVFACIGYDVLDYAA